MPRKKIEPELTEVVSAPPVAEKSKARARKPKAEPVAEAVIAAPKARSSRAKKAEPAVVETAAPEPTKASASKAKPVEPKVAAKVVLRASPVAPAPTGAPAKKVVKTLAEEVEEEKLQPKPKRRPVPVPPTLAAAPKLATKPPAKRKASTNVAGVGDDAPLVILEWRPRQAGPVPSREEPTAPRKSRGRRRQDHQDLEITAAAALEEQPAERAERPRRERSDRQNVVFREVKAPVEPPEVKEARFEKPAAPIGPPPKPLLPTPDDAPQVVLRDGMPTLVRNKRVYPPFAFFGSASDEQRAKTVLDEIKMAAEAGVHIHSLLIDFEVSPEAVSGSVALAAYLLAQTVKVDPEAQVLFRLVFVAPPNWTELFPNARYHGADGVQGDPSVCDDQYWAVARDCLASFVRQMRMLPLQQNILGLHLERGEWFLGEDWGYDTSPSAKFKFREWARQRYQGDEVALRAAWFDGQVSFNTLGIPTYQHPEKSGDKFVRSSRRERRWVDYHLCLSDATVERIAELAYAAKEASEGYFLVGASYGYTFEWSHPASGHLSLGKLLRTPEIDFIAGPPSYRSREPGGAAPFPCPIDSLALNGKLYLSEEDFKTSIGTRNEPDEFNPIIKTPQSLESVHWRGVGSALAHGSGVCWMDLWGNGWLKTNGTWDRAKKVQDALISRMAGKWTDPDVAIFIDERALAYLANQRAFALLVQNVRESVLRSGLSAGFYLLSDLQHRERFPEAKLYVFLNAWDVRPELRAAIKNRLQCDNKVLFWLYVAGLFDSGRESLERAREVTGIALRPQPFSSKTGTTILSRRHPLAESFAEPGLVAGGNLEPSYFAIPEESSVLGEYSQTGLPSFVVREFHSGDQSWKSVFLGEPAVTPALMRALGQMAGAHVWNFHEDVVHVRAPFLTIHCRGAGQRTITLPNKWRVYNMLEGRWEQTETNSYRFQAIEGSTHLFLVGTQEEIEQVLSADPQDLLHMENLPEKPLDSVRMDSGNFDIPIVRLDEWMEGAEDDELADDFLFRPQLIEETEEEPEESVIGRRRRKRRKRSDDGSAIDRGNSTGSVNFDDLGMSVMFRKRE